MKLSIWQQFSSNHSSYFTVVGVFETREQAEHAATEIRAILNRLEDWHEAHEAEMLDLWSTGDYLFQPFPIEQEIAEAYGIAWQGGIDWYEDAKIEVKLDRMVFITPKWQSAALGNPFDQLMTKMGGQGYHDTSSLGGDDVHIIFDLTCDAPDEATAIHIYEKYLGFNQRILRDRTHLYFKQWLMEGFDVFPDLIAELQERGCKNIAYTFTQLDPETPISLHDETDVEVLIEVLMKAQDSDDRRKAAHLLGDICDVRAVEPLIATLDTDDDWLQNAVIRALGSIGDPQAIEAMRPFLNAQAEWTRNAAVEALRKLGDSSVS